MQHCESEMTDGLTVLLFCDVYIDIHVGATLNLHMYYACVLHVFEPYRLPGCQYLNRTDYQCVDIAGTAGYVHVHVAIATIICSGSPPVFLECSSIQYNYPSLLLYLEGFKQVNTAIAEWFAANRYN